MSFMKTTEQVHQLHLIASIHPLSVGSVSPDSKDIFKLHHTGGFQIPRGCIYRFALFCLSGRRLMQIADTVLQNDSELPPEAVLSSTAVSSFMPVLGCVPISIAGLLQ